MKTSASFCLAVAGALSLASMATAVPLCATNCFTKVIAEHPPVNCKEANMYLCFCKASDLQTWFSECAYSTCTSQAEAVEALGFGINTCKDLGITLTVPARPSTSATQTQRSTTAPSSTTKPQTSSPSGSSTGGPRPSSSSSTSMSPRTTSSSSSTTKPSASSSGSATTKPSTSSSGSATSTTAKASASSAVVKANIGNAVGVAPGLFIAAGAFVGIGQLL